MDQNSASKLTTTQNVIRNKFEQAYTNRLEHEHNVNRVMNSLTSDSKCKEHDFPSQHLSKSSTRKNLQQLQLTTESYPIHSNDPNDLCTSLRKLLSSQIADNVNRTHEINSIIDQLREHEIII